MFFLFWLIIDRFPWFVHLGPACSSVAVRNPCDNSLHCEARGIRETGWLKVRKQLLNCSICNCCGEFIELSYLIHVHCTKGTKRFFYSFAYGITYYYSDDDMILLLQATCTILAMIATVPLAQLLCFHILLIKKVSYFQTVIKAVNASQRELPLFYYGVWSIHPSIYPKLWQLLFIIYGYLLLRLLIVHSIIS
jgi:hypothetical protein